MGSPCPCHSHGGEGQACCVKAQPGGTTHSTPLPALLPSGSSPGSLTSPQGPPRPRPCLYLQPPSPPPSSPGQNRLHSISQARPCLWVLAQGPRVCPPPTGMRSPCHEALLGVHLPGRTRTVLLTSVCVGPPELRTQRTQVYAVRTQRLCFVQSCEA